MRAGGEEIRTSPQTNAQLPAADIERYREIVAAGQTSFNNVCTACHDADKALSKRTSLGQWRATVQRMAAKDGADVPPWDIEAIATYLIALGAPATDGAVANVALPPMADGTAPGVVIYGTLSPTYRGGNENLQNGGLVPDVWLGVGMQTASPLSGRVTSCISCHTEPGVRSRIELVEAALRLDLIRTLGRSDWPVRSSIDAGRFVVPFGSVALPPTAH